MICERVVLEMTVRCLMDVVDAVLRDRSTLYISVRLILALGSRTSHWTSIDLGACNYWHDVVFESDLGRKFLESWSLYIRLSIARELLWGDPVRLKDIPERERARPLLRVKYGQILNFPCVVSV